MSENKEDVNNAAEEAAKVKAEKEAKAKAEKEAKAKAKAEEEAKAKAEEEAKAKNKNADQKKAEELMKEHDVKTVYKVGRCWFTKHEYAKNAAGKDGVIKTFNK